MIKYININGKNYMYPDPIDYQGLKSLKKRIKAVKEKIRARENGYLKGKEAFANYPELLIFLETLI